MRWMITWTTPREPEQPGQGIGGVCLQVGEQGAGHRPPGIVPGTKLTSYVVDHLGMGQGPQVNRGIDGQKLCSRPARY